MLKRILSEPLLHFLAVGAALFLLFEWMGDEKVADAGRIVVDRAALVTFLQGHNPRMTRDEGEGYLEGLERKALNDLVEAFVREEVLVREARALGLDRDDYASRRRLVSQLAFLNEGFIAETGEVSDEELSGWYDAHAEDYKEPARVTFTHVFIKGDEGARARAMETLGLLNAQAVPFHQAMQHGERFLYHRNYVRSSRDEVASHFGEAFATEAFAARVDKDRWQGPWRSEYGWHLVLLTGSTPARRPALEEIRSRVTADVIAARVREAREAFYRSARRRYDVHVELPAEGEGA